MEDETHLAAIRQDWETEKVCSHFTAEDGRCADRERCQHCGWSEISHDVAYLLTQLDAQAQVIATLTQERDGNSTNFKLRITAELRADAAESRLTRLTEGLRAVLGHLDGTTSEVDAVAILQALLAAPESPTTPEQ